MDRERQIRFTARLVRALSRNSAARRLLSFLQTSRSTQKIYERAVGYRRPFATLAEAQAAIAGYEHFGHESDRNVPHHLELSSSPRPSDYTALAHLQPLIAELHNIFDLGGNAGNLFYCYTHSLPWPPDLIWQVLDLPANMQRGAAIAGERGAHSLRFTSNWTAAAASDLLIVSGSLHYMERPLPAMLRELPTLPKYLLINRTPLTDSAPFAAVQVASGFRLAAMIYNRSNLWQQIAALGYDQIDEWKATELSMEIPGYPQCNIPAYSGAFFRRR